MLTATQPQSVSNTRRRFDAQVVSNTSVCREHFCLTLGIDPDERGPFPATRPGQFIQLGCQPATLLRRPFSLAGRKDLAEGRVELQIVYRVVGVGTRWLAQLQAGDTTDLLGPLGNQFQLPEGKSLGLLVGGGVGLPPMFYLAEALKQAHWDAVAFVGALTEDLLAVTFGGSEPAESSGEPSLCIEEFSKLSIASAVTTDDGSVGLAGRITAGLERYFDTLSEEDRQRVVLFTCGPHPMLHAAAKLAQKHGVDCQVCLEQAMACGMGTCQSCIVQIAEPDNPQGTTEDGRPWRYRLTCTDGPVFNADQVIF